jgi:hypothetical protein
MYGALSSHKITENKKKKKSSAPNASTHTYTCAPVLCCQLASANPGTGKFSLPVPVKSTGVQFVLVLPQDEKS